MPDDIENTKLLEVLKSHYKDLSPHFRVYDNEYATGNYELPKTELLVLILISFIDNASGGLNEHVWTTIRRWTPEKEKYYKSIRGEYVKIEIDA